MKRARLHSCSAGQCLDRAQRVPCWLTCLQLQGGSAGPSARQLRTKPETDQILQPRAAAAGSPASMQHSHSALLTYAPSSPKLFRPLQGRSPGHEEALLPTLRF